jgi:DNA-binding beta-propeller fold protein YncE
VAVAALVIAVIAAGTAVGLRTLGGGTTSGSAVTTPTVPVYLGTTCGSVVELRPSSRTVDRLVQLPTSVPDPSLGVLAVAPDGRTIYAGNRSTGTVWAIGAQTGQVLHTFQVGRRLDSLALSPSGNVAYLGTGGSLSGLPETSGDMVVPLDLVRGTVDQPIGLPEAARKIVLSPEGSTAYVVGMQSTGGTGDLISLDLRSGKVHDVIHPPSSPASIALSPTGRTAYLVTQSKASLVPIDLKSGTVGRTVSMGGIGGDVVVAPDGDTVYASHLGAGSWPAVIPRSLSHQLSGDPATQAKEAQFGPVLSVVGVPSGTVEGSMAIGGNDTGSMALAQADGLLLVATSHDPYSGSPAPDRIVIVSLRHQTVTTSIPLPCGPQSIAVASGR